MEWFPSSSVPSIDLAAQVGGAAQIAEKKPAARQYRRVLIMRRQASYVIFIRTNKAGRR